jgi:AcrR family transcriptional regulator
MVIKESKKSKSRDEIIEAAQRYFHVSGVRAASMNELASALGLPRSTLYYHFDERSELVYELASRALAEVTAKAVEISRYPLPPSQRIRIFVRTILRFEIESGSIPLSILVRDPTVLGPEKWDEIKSGRDVYENVVRDLFREGVESGEFIEIDVKIVTFALLAMLEHIDVWFDPSGPRSCDEIADIYCSLVLRGISREAPQD